MTINTLKDLYIDQLQDIYSANRQSAKVTQELHKAAHSEDLKSALKAGVDGIEEGMDQIKRLIQNHDADPRGEHCKGMEGLVAEARAHGIEADIADEDVRDASIIAQYQRMTHYGISGYGTACAFAKRLGLKDDAKVLDTCLDNTRDGDKHMTSIASGEVNRAAAQA
ncbi:ferritin-like domain-containing protein [Erythrobacter sp. NFXS35]|uniref:YciE/YciF ferroxidase family protein n=1 Tax=Erythrobacter sp. NFXS35 TaxID=2818436 RepID=UPI0032DE30AC